MNKRVTSKYERILNKVITSLRRELKYDAESINGTGLDDYNDDSGVCGRYELARELLHAIRLELGTLPSEPVHAETYVSPKELFEDQAIQDAIAYAEKLITPKDI